MQYHRQSLQLGQDSIAYIDQGAGPVLLCLHAIGHSADDYSGLITALSARFRCIAVDFPGHGESSAGSRTTSTDYYADVVQALVQKLAIDSLIILGNSIGGGTAITLAARMPDRVQALVLCNPAGIFERSFVSRLAVPLFASVFAQGEKRARWYKTFFALYYRLVLKNAAARTRRDEIVAQAYEHARVCREAWQSFAAPESDLRDVARGLRLPILVAWATQDRVNRLQLNLPTIRGLQNGVLKTYRAGHIAFLECPDEFVRDFNEFVYGGTTDNTASQTNALGLQT